MKKVKAIIEIDLGDYEDFDYNLLIEDLNKSNTLKNDLIWLKEGSLGNVLRFEKGKVKKLKVKDSGFVTDWKAGK